MKTNLIKQTLVALTLGSLGLVATGAHANDNRSNAEGAYGSRISANVQFGTQPQGRFIRASDYRDNRHDHQRHAYRQSQQFQQQVDARQHRQMDRIQAGRNSGALTHREFRELMHEQRDIRNMKQQFLADGFLDKREYRRIDRALDIASTNIRSEKHDHQARNGHSYYR